MRRSNRPKTNLSKAFQYHGHPDFIRFNEITGEAYVVPALLEEYDPELVKMRVITEVYQQLITDLKYIGQEELDACETLINFSNCLLRVEARDVTTVPHTPTVYSTIQIPCRWTGKPSPTPVFDRYLHTLTNGDTALQQLLLEFIGACISNVKGWRMKKSLFLVGDGDTGKSQLKSLVERLLGKENFIGIDLKEIECCLVPDLPSRERKLFCGAQRPDSAG